MRMHFEMFLNCCRLKLLAWKKCCVFLSKTTVLLLLFQSYISDNCCVQVDPTGSGRVAAADAALFLKRSGLADLVLGKVRKESDQCISVTSLVVPSCSCWGWYVNCTRVHRSGIWQTLNEKVLSTSRYDRTARSRHNGFGCAVRTKCIWSQEWHHMLYLWSPQQFFIALRLVACAQNGLEVALKSLNVAVPPPKFVSPPSTSLGSVCVLSAVAYI